MEEENHSRRAMRYGLLAAMSTLAVTMLASGWVCVQAIRAEAFARYNGIKNVSAEKTAKIIRGIEMNAQNIFDEVNNNMGSPKEVIEALREKVNLNLDTRGYFAAFEPNYFPKEGKWFEPYVYQPDVAGFEYRQVGSELHDYTKSPWYVRAKKTNESFWSEPYYYEDGTSMSGYYCTFIKPLYDSKGNFVCVCGADMKFDWLAKELAWVDQVSKSSILLNTYHLFKDFSFYSVILNRDGKCISRPGSNSLAIEDQDVVRNLVQKKSGVVKQDVNGNTCLIYYGPIEYIDWSLAIVVPMEDILKSVLPALLELFLITAVGMLAVWLIFKKTLLKTPQNER